MNWEELRKDEQCIHDTVQETYVNSELSKFFVKFPIRFYFVVVLSWAKTALPFPLLFPFTDTSENSLLLFFPPNWWGASTHHKVVVSTETMVREGERMPVKSYWEQKLILTYISLGQLYNHITSFSIIAI